MNDRNAKLMDLMNRIENSEDANLIDTTRFRLARAENILEEVGGQLAFYAQNHLKKGTKESAKKAQVNAELVVKISEFLARE